jgi:hypothetical protein
VAGAVRHADQADDAYVARRHFRSLIISAARSRGLCAQEVCAQGPFQRFDAGHSPPMQAINVQRHIDEADDKSLRRTDASKKPELKTPER